MVVPGRPGMPVWPVALLTVHELDTDGVKIPFWQVAVRDPVGREPVLQVAVADVPGYNGVRVRFQI